MTLLKKVRTLAAKVETTPGTDASLSASDGAFNAYDVMFQPNVTVEQRQGQGAFNKLSGVAGARRGTATFKVDIGWDGTTTMPTWASVLLAGCGVVESSQVYTPRSEAPGSNVKTLTLGCYEDGKLKQLVGAVGNAKFVCPTGRMVTIEFTFEGVWVTPTDTAIISPTYPTALPIKFTSTTITYDSVALKVEQFTLDLGNSIYVCEDPSTAAGLSHGIITDRTPIATANPQAVLVATQARELNLINGTEAAIAVTLDGPSDSTIAFSIPKAQLTNVQEGERSDLVTDELEWSCNKNSATSDQEFSITFTEAT